MLEAIWNWLRADTAFPVQIFRTLLAMVGIWLARFLAVWLVNQSIKDQDARYRWRKFIGALAYICGLIIVGRIWFPNGSRDIATFFGLIAAGIAISLQRPLTNLFGWVFIIWRRPFNVGDRIETNKIAGDVIDIGALQFALLEIGNWVDADQSTGRIIHIPNGSVFEHPVANYSRGLRYIWNELSLTISFESDWQKAKQILDVIANRHDEHSSERIEQNMRRASQRYLIRYTKLNPRVYTTVREQGIGLTIRYLCDPRRRRGTAESIWEDVLLEFRQHPDINFAYPTWRVYNARTEGPVMETNGSIADRVHSPPQRGPQ